MKHSLLVGSRKPIKLRKLEKLRRPRKVRKLQDLQGSTLSTVINAVNNGQVKTLLELLASWTGSSRNTAVGSYHPR